LYPHARRVGEETDAARSAIAKLQSPEARPLRVVADPTYGRVLLSPLVPRFLEAFAHVPLEVALDAQQLAAGAWDVAIRTRPPADGSVTQRLLGAPPALLCATPAYLQQRGMPARPDDLRSHDLLTPDAAELPEFRLLLERGAQRAEVPLRPKLAVDDPAVLHAATAAGLGVGLLPEFLCRQGLATGRLKPVLSEWTVPPAAALYALYPAALESDPRVQQFVDFLAANIVPALALPVPVRPPPIHPSTQDFVLEELLGAGSLAASAELADYSDELARSVLEEAARFAEGVLEPLNRPGDLHGARWTPDGVVTAPGFRDAYRQFAAGGWTALGADPNFGGHPAPRALVTAAGEFWGSACLAFKLGPMLTHGAVHALELCGSATQKERYLKRMISGEWTGTMVLTEPQAGSDLGLVRTRAVPDGDRYRLFGQKIFITWGDHDLTPNTLHMVLARIEGAPTGVRGISLFVVPKVLVNADGSLGARNDVRCLSIEHKLGIHASPTCVLAF